MFAAGIVVAGAPGMAATGWFGDVPGVMDPMEPPQVTAEPNAKLAHPPLSANVAAGAVAKASLAHVVMRPMATMA